MKRVVATVIGSALVTTALLAPGSPAAADPCGASSYVSGSTQYVGYRNCSSSTSGRMAGVIGGQRGPCYLVPGNGSATLHSRNTGGVMLSWSVVGC